MRSTLIKAVPVAALLAVVLLSCGERRKAEPFTPTFSTYTPSEAEAEIAPERREVFYGLLTPVEITYIFERLNIPYEREVLNPTGNVDNYMTSAKAALNLGVYGVNLGYLKIFNRNQDMVRYLFAVRTLADRLNVPEEYLLAPVREIERDMADADSVMAIMNRSFENIESHLRQYGRESTAGLMIMGGYIEALYLATNLALDPENPDPAVVQRIAEQKYTLNTLLTFMRNYYDDPMVVFYTKKLLYLKRYFDTFNIYYKADDLEIDTSRQVIVASGSDMTITLETLFNIRNYLARLRQEIIE